MRAFPADAGRWLRTEGTILTEAPWIFAAPTGANKVTVYWDEVPGATGYRVRWGTASEVYPNASGVLPADARRFTVEGLVSEQEYYFVVEAGRNGVWSAPSEEDSAVPHVGAIPWDTEDPDQIIPAIRWALGIYDEDIDALSPDGWYYSETGWSRWRERAFRLLNSSEIIASDGALFAPYPQRTSGQQQCTNTGPYRRIETRANLNDSTIKVKSEFYLPPRRYNFNSYFDIPNDTRLTTRDTPHVYFGFEYSTYNGRRTLQVDVEGGISLHPAGRGQLGPNDLTELNAPDYDRWVPYISIVDGRRGANPVAVAEGLRSISYGANGSDAPFGFIVNMMLSLSEGDSRDKLVVLRVEASKYVLDEQRSYKRVMVGTMMRKSRPIPSPDERVRARRVVSIAQRRGHTGNDGWKRTGAFFMKCGVGYAPLVTQEWLQGISVFLKSPNDSGSWQLWDNSISDPPQNCPPTGVISVESPIDPWYREVVNIDLRRR